METLNGVTTPSLAGIDARVVAVIAYIPLFMSLQIYVSILNMVSFVIHTVKKKGLGKCLSTYDTQYFVSSISKVLQ